jgi:hypothetical protein
MLFNIDSNCSPELLYCLAQMGHGDELVIADRNFPGHINRLADLLPKSDSNAGFQRPCSYRDNHKSAAASTGLWTMLPCAWKSTARRKR